MNRIALLLLLSIVVSLFAQQEAGEFDRPSITYMDRLLKVDRSIDGLGPKYNRLLVERMGKQLTLPRYDYNEIPQVLHDSFDKRMIPVENTFAGNRDTCLSVVTDLMNEIIAPPILSVVEMNRDLRAQERMTEQQRNSFIKDKAKELGFTEDEVRRVMNSAYIFMPYASDFHERTWKDTIYHKDTVVIAGKVRIKVSNRIKEIKHYYKTSMRMGLKWWKIVPGKDGKPSYLEGYEPLVDAGSKKVELTKRYQLNNKYVEPRHYAKAKMIYSLGSDFGQRLRDFEDFKLSGQVLDKRAGFVGIDIGAREGIMVDDVFMLMESIEEGGKTIKKENGWVLVRKVADSSSSNGYKSSAQVIGGRPYIGMELKEKPMGSGKSSIQFLKGIYETVEKEGEFSNLLGLKLNNGYGARLEVGGHVGRGKGFSQLYVMLGGGFTLGSAEGRLVEWDVERDLFGIPVIDSVTGKTIPVALTKHDITSVVGGHYDISLMKRFYVRRFALVLQTGLGYQHIKFNMDDNEERTEDTLEYHLKSSAWGGFSNVFGEIAFTPRFGIGGGVGYRYFGKTDRFVYRSKEKNNEEAKYRREEDIVDGPTIDMNGMTWGFYVTFRPSINLRN